MRIFPIHKQYINDHIVNGEWTGNFHFGKPVMIIEDEQVMVETVLSKLGMPPLNKYTEDTADEGMGKTHDHRDTTVVGDGDSQSEE